MAERVGIGHIEPKGCDIEVRQYRRDDTEQEQRA